MGRKNKNDGVYTQFYLPHLKGGEARYRANLTYDTSLLIERMYHRMLTELSLNRFKWSGLPETVDERFLELSLLEQGSVLFHNFSTPETGERFLVSKFINTGVVNHYDNPTRFRIVSTGGIQAEYDSNEAVPIWGNYLRQPDNDIIFLYTQRLKEIDVTVDVNTRNLRYPRVMVYPEESKLTMTNLAHQIDSGVPTLKINSAMGDISDYFHTLDLGGHHETIPALLTSKSKLWNECLTMLGVSVVNDEKKERLITGETRAGTQQSEVIRNIALNSRQQAVEQINNMFNLDIEVSWRSDEEQDELFSQAQNMFTNGDSDDNDGGFDREDEEL